MTSANPANICFASASAHARLPQIKTLVIAVDLQSPRSVPTTSRPVLHHVQPFTLLVSGVNGPYWVHSWAGPFAIYTLQLRVIHKHQVSILFINVELETYMNP